MCPFDRRRACAPARAVAVPANRKRTRACMSFAAPLLSDPRLCDLPRTSGCNPGLRPAAPERGVIGLSLFDDPFGLPQRKLPRRAHFVLLFDDVVRILR